MLAFIRSDVRLCITDVVRLRQRFSAMNVVYVIIKKIFTFIRIDGRTLHN